MPTRIVKPIFAVIVMVIAGAALQPRTAHQSPSYDAGANAASIALAETSASGPSLQAMASHTPANQLGVNRPTFSEPFLLLLMGSLLIGVGTSFRRWTTRRAPRPAMTRRT
ncbi:MAG: hypothetical protein ACJ74J_04925 [Blastocatellia bacterium]